VNQSERENMKEALLVIDVQNIYFHGFLMITYPPGSLENIQKAMDHASAHGIPVVVIQHSASTLGGGFSRGSEDWKLHPVIQKRQRDVLIEKSLPGSFTGTGLEEWLKVQGIERVVISGYMTQMCCDTTARQALHLGYKVIFLSDATGTLTVKNSAGQIQDKDLHRAALITQAMRFSEVKTTEEWITSSAVS
jgi:nicotinamidase-related amidase